MLNVFFIPPCHSGSTSTYDLIKKIRTRTHIDKHTHQHTHIDRDPHTKKRPDSLKRHFNAASKEFTHTHTPLNRKVAFTNAHVLALIVCCLQKQYLLNFKGKLNSCSF